MHPPTIFLGLIVFLNGSIAQSAEPSAAAPWQGNRIGISDEVIPPWTPVVVAGETVGVWGRTHRFGPLPLPASVITRDAEILAGPITLTGVVDGRPISWGGAACRVVEAKPHLARLDTKAESDALCCEGEVKIEYDGMVRCDFTLRPRGEKATIERLALEIPLDARHAAFLHTWPGNWDSVGNSVALPKAGYRGPFKPFVWLGDHERGFCWFSESDRNFFSSKPNEVLEIERIGEQVVLRVHLVTVPQTIDRPLEYTFGFQATPVKPAQPDAWDYRIVHMGGYGIEKQPYPRRASIRYSAKGHWDLAQGTFECWVRPHFNPQPDVKVDDPGRGGFNRNLLEVILPDGRVGFYWNVDDRGMRAYYKQGDKHLLVFGARTDWQAGEWHHVALTWGDVTRIYFDGKKIAEQKHAGSIVGDLTTAEIVLGESPCEMDIDEIRISSAAREEFDLSRAPEADAQTLLLDHLDETFAADGYRTTTPTKGAGGVVSDGMFAAARFGHGLCMPEMNATLLDRLSSVGVRTICFHEHWTDIQNYPRTTREKELKSLADGCHEHGIELLLYFGYLMSDIAPEWEKHHEECLVLPRTGDYRREPKQTAYIVCYRSPWQDFLADGIGKLMEQSGIDGVYLDGTSEPWGCTNQRHGCGYKRPDGSVGTTYPFFATRQMMKRIYTIVKHGNPAGQVNVHQSTCMTIPTLAFATSYWDGEQLQGLKRHPSALDVLPLDAFCAEFMGHNWGVPAELLWYAGGPFSRVEAMSLGLLHDVPVRPGDMADVEVAGRLWKTFDTFGRHEATWLPYWANAGYVQTEPTDVKVSLYNRPGKGLIAVIVNTGHQPCQAVATFDLAALQQPADLVAHDVLADKPLPVVAGRVQLPLGPLEHAVVWLKPGS